MEKLLKIIKINILSLIALPLLVTATASKLIAKALEKLALILGMLILTLFVVMGFEFFKNPESGLEVLLTILAVFFIGFLIIMIIFFVMTVMASVVTAVWAAVIGFFEVIYDVTYTGFLKLYAVCGDDYQFISLTGSKASNALFCLFYTILNAVNKLIVTVISFALPASFLLSLFLVADAIIGIHIRVKADFGIGLFQFLGKFDAFSVVYGIVMFIMVMALFVTVLISLGAEWHEWAQELKLTEAQMDEDVRELQNRSWSMEQKGEDSEENGDADLRELEEHINGLEPLADTVESVLDGRDNPLLRSAWGNYYRSLSSIVDECGKYRQGIPRDKFKRLIPRIRQLGRLRSEVQTLVEKQRRENANPAQSSVFFAGCSDMEKLEKRYKTLCKAYHPDTGGGDTETFQKMQEEYNTIKAGLMNEN